jgi:hypothetical protein
LLSAKPPLGAKPPHGAKPPLTITPPFNSAGEIAAHRLETDFPKFNRIVHRLSDGGLVTLSLYGPGSLKGTTFVGDTLYLSFNATDAQHSGIVGRVTGGTGRAKLGAIVPFALRDNPYSPTGTGAPPINYINLHQFDLQQHGIVNLLGGIGAFFLGSAGPNTTINMKQGPISPILNPFTRQGVVSTDTTGRQIIAPTTVGVTLPGGSTFAGEAIINPDAAALTTSSTTSQRAFEGIDFQINRIDAAPAPDGGARLQNPDIYAAAYDPATQSAQLLLYRYDPLNKNASLAPGSTPVPILAPGAVTTPPEVGLARYTNAMGLSELVVLVGFDSTVIAYDALNPAVGPIGSFTTTGLRDVKGNPITARITGVGSTSNATVLSFAQPPANGDLTTTAGTLQKIDVTASLNSGMAVPLGLPFSAQKGFNQTGGVTGVAESNAVATVGAAHFNSFTPDLFQAGFLGVTPNNRGLTEAARGQITAPLLGSTITNATPDYTFFARFQALGSIEQNLALVTASNIVNDQNGNPVSVDNKVSLYNAGTQSATFFATADFPTALGFQITGLSESFHPELVGSALIDVQGNLRSLQSSFVRGGVVNVNGTLQTLRVGTMSDSTVVGRPLAHVDIRHRGANVNLLSTPQRKGTRGGVQVFTVNQLRPFGPLVEPAPRTPPPIPPGTTSGGAGAGTTQDAES